MSAISRNTHVVRAEPYDREVVAVVQFHSWYHLDALHATPRFTTTTSRLPVDGELRTEVAAWRRSLNASADPTQLQD